NLNFHVDYHNIPDPFELKWKVKNEGEQALKQGCLRGEITDDDGSLSRTESTSFEGDHYVECYAIQNKKVVARDRILVPIA
ncbi:nucleotide-binding domain-containing protein, partial [Vibrio anguillarum]|nr:nucleotidyltransferase [Vibrio anguillarum]